MVKTEVGPNSQVSLQRELHNYRLAAVASSQHFRSLHDTFGTDKDDGDDGPVPYDSTTEEPLCMVFEWMDTDMRGVPSYQFRQNANLPRTVAKSVLSALAVLKTKYNAIHAGEFPASRPRIYRRLKKQTSTPTTSSSPTLTDLLQWRRSEI